LPKRCRWQTENRRPTGGRSRIAGRWHLTSSRRGGRSSAYPSTDKGDDRNLISREIDEETGCRRSRPRAMRSDVNTEPLRRQASSRALALRISPADERPTSEKSSFPNETRSGVPRIEKEKPRSPSQPRPARHAADDFSMRAALDASNITRV
jgi:hypothetical protein